MNEPTIEIKTEMEDTLSPRNYLNNTYNQSSLKNVDGNSQNSLNITGPLSKKSYFNKTRSLNSTKTTITKKNLIHEDTIEELKRQLKDETDITDMNRLSYCLDSDTIKFEPELDEMTEINKTVDIKRSSISTGSTDSLDRMSSMSNSSRGSNRILSMADVDAIVEMQEKSKIFMSI